MSDRLTDAKKAFAEYRHQRWVEHHRDRDRDPDLFDTSTWEQPASASETWQADALEVVRQAARPGRASRSRI